jgi:hypothetical protein
MKKDGKGERHGTDAERLLAKKSTTTSRPPAVTAATPGVHVASVSRTMVTRSLHVCATHRISSAGRGAFMPAPVMPRATPFAMPQMGAPLGLAGPMGECDVVRMVRACVHVLRAVLVLASLRTHIAASSGGMPQFGGMPGMPGMPPMYFGAGMPPPMQPPVRVVGVVMRCDARRVLQSDHVIASVATICAAVWTTGFPGSIRISVNSLTVNILDA